MRGLGPAKALIEYCYDIVRRDGWCHFKLVDVADAMVEPYVTVKRWWKTIEQANAEHGFFVEVRNRGRLGFELRFADRWLDWRILGQRLEPEGPKEVSKLIPLTQEEGSKEVSKVMLFNGIAPEIVSKEGSKEGSEVIPLEPAYKVLIDSDQAPPPPPTQPPRAESAPTGAGGGGGLATPDPADPVYALFANPRYGITQAKRLMPLWQNAPPDQVAQLLERLYAQHHDPTNPRYTGARLYQKLQAGPGVLLKPPPATARASPVFTPPPRAAPTDPEAMRRALAAAKLKSDPVET